MIKRSLLVLSLLTIGGLDGLDEHARAQGLLDVSVLSASALEAKLSSHRTALQERRAEQALLAQELAELPTRERSLEEALTHDVRALYRLRRGGLLPIVDGLDALLGHASRVAHFERMSRRNLRALRDSQQSSERLRSELARVEQAIASTEQELASLEQGAATLAREAAASAALDRAPSTEASDASAFATSSSGASYGLSIVGASDSAPRSARFASQRGTLALPVPGQAAVANVVPPSGEGRALTFHTAAGGSVRAAADGRVVSAEPHEGHGILVIVDHGERYRTVYGGLTTVDVQAGDALSKSARLGTAGSVPVYFEVRRGLRSQDARSWLGL